MSEMHIFIKNVSPTPVNTLCVSLPWSIPDPSNSACRTGSVNTAKIDFARASIRRDTQTNPGRLSSIAYHRYRRAARHGGWYVRSIARSRESGMITPSVSESRDIDAPAARIFSILSNPAMHPAVDGTGMLRSASDNSPLTSVGDVFNIEMVHWHLGNYVMANHVVEFEQDRLIGWEPVVYSYENPEYRQSVGHPGLREWGWQLEPLSEDKTRVTAFFEGSRLPESLREFIQDGEFWRPAMVTSLDNLERIVAQSGEDQELPDSDTAAPFIELFRGA